MNRFDIEHWNQTVARIVDADDQKEVAAALTDAIGLVVSHEGTCLLLFHKSARPEVIHHSLEPAGARHYLDRYLAGPYLLDPLYGLAFARKRPDSCRFREEHPDRFRSSEYYRRYCEQTHLLDEMDYFVAADSKSTLVLVVGRRDRMFSKAALRRLAGIQPLILAAMRRVCKLHNGRTGRGKDVMHQRLLESFDTFGEGVLTGRERQVSQLLLRGHSSKSIARELRIAPGTVMVHKRNLFAKLDIKSQYELFSLFIDGLAGAR